MQGLPSTRGRSALLIAAATLCCSCTVSLMPYLPQIYYQEGPEVGLELLATYGAGARLRVLGAMEESMMRLELGEYAGARDAASRARTLIGEITAGAPAPENAVLGARGEFIGAPFERAWTATVAVIASLALQDVETAAADAERLAEDLERCPTCRDPFSRFTAASALAATGRRDDALRVLGGDPPDGEGAALWAAERVRLAGGGLLAGTLRTLPPPREAAGRQLLVYLLLGRGPGRGETQDAAGREPDWSETAAAQLVTPSRSPISWVPLTDVRELAGGAAARDRERSDRGSVGAALVDPSCGRGRDPGLARPGCRLGGASLPLVRRRGPRPRGGRSPAVMDRRPALCRPQGALVLLTMSTLAFGHRCIRLLAFRSWRAARVRLGRETPASRRPRRHRTYGEEHLARRGTARHPAMRPTYRPVRGRSGVRGVRRATLRSWRSTGGTSASHGPSAPWSWSVRTTPRTSSAT